MEAETFTLDWANNKLVVTYTDGSVREYTDRASYLADHPDRASDCDALGWA